MKRVTVEEVQEALDRIGFRLARYITIDKENKLCCPIGALAFDRNVSLTELGLEDRYRAGFMVGFDDPGWRIADIDEAAVLGLSDGSSAFRHFFPDRVLLGDER